MLIDGLIYLVQANPDTNALVGDWVYENSIPRGNVFPAVVVHSYNGTQDYDYAGPIGIREQMVQFDTYGRTSVEARKLREAVRRLISRYKGTLPDGTTVQAAFLEREMDMPFLPNADAKGVSNRSVLGFRIVTENE